MKLATWKLYNKNSVYCSFEDNTHFFECVIPATTFFRVNAETSYTYDEICDFCNEVLTFSL